MGENARMCATLTGWTIEAGTARHASLGTWKDKGNVWKRVTAGEAWLSAAEMLAMMGGAHESHAFALDEPGEWGMDDPYCERCGLPPDAVEAAMPCARAEAENVVEVTNG